ncbi:MAG: signal peptidase I [Lachnospiraceae bacterium]|nr:signal peptidase I [Lachnospiraceae bacterium]
MSEDMMTQKIPHMASIPTEEEVEAERKRLAYQKRYRSTLRNTIYMLIVVAAVAILLATLFLPVLQVSGTSMEPTLSDGDVILLVKTGDFETGDLIGFYYQNKLLLKRVIGGPGDIIDIDEEGNVTVNGELLDEPYLTEKALGETDLTYPYQVPESRYFVMGDNRLTSIDSRSSAIGCIEEDQIAGKVVLRIWPLNSISLIS